MAGGSGTCRGYTRTELLITIAVALALSSAVFVLIGDRRRSQDANRLREIHQSMVTWSQGNRDFYPWPGRVWRTHTQEEISMIMAGRPSPPPHGFEDFTKNTTADFYSLLIAHEYITPHVLSSPRDRNPAVRPNTSYDYSAHNPAGHSYWDRSFKADLETISHVSYAHLLLHGARMRLRWMNSSPLVTPILSNRGPLRGEPDRQSFTTRRDGSWAGFIVFADNSVSWHDTVTPPGVEYQPFTDPVQEPVPDNVFDAEFDDNWHGAPLGSADIFLTFTLRFEGKERGIEPVIQHD